MRTILAAITDKHAMHTLGLLNPETILYKKGDNNETIPYTPQLTPDQMFLWKLHERIIETTIDLAKGDPIILADLGDQTQGTVIIDDIDSMKMADHIIAAEWNLIPWMTISNLVEVLMVGGTGVHEWYGSAIVLISQFLSEKFPEIKLTPFFHSITTVDKARIDLAHHGPNQSSRKWLEGNLARGYLQSTMMDEIMDGNTPPELYLRGHFHQLVNEVITRYARDQWFESRIVVVPPLCLIGDYARKKTMSAHKITVGGVVFEIIDNNVSKPIFITETIDVRKEIKI